MGTRHSLFETREFEDTLPTGLSQGMAAAFGPTGIEAIKASTVDAASQHFLGCWRIVESDGALDVQPVDDLQGDGCPRAMATIVQLSPGAHDEIVTRQTDACSWAFAWLLDAGRIAVAEVRYHRPRGEPDVGDCALVRLICDTAVFAGDKPGAATLPGPLGAAPEPAPRLAALPQADHAAERAAPGRTSAVGAAPRGRPLPTALRVVGWWLLAAYLTIAAVAMLLDAERSRREAELQAQQQTDDRAMAQSLAPVLATGDYGEVQAALDALAGRGLFTGAAVGNARGRAVAAAGEVRDVRMGDPIADEVAGRGRVIALAAPDGSALGRLVVWHEGPPPSTLPSVAQLWVAALSCAAVATLVAFAWVRTRLRRGGGLRRLR